MMLWDGRLLSFFQRCFPNVTFVNPVEDDDLWPASYVVSHGLNELAGHYGFEIELDLSHDDPQLFMPRIRTSSATGARVGLKLIEDFLGKHRAVGEDILSGEYMPEVRNPKREHKAEIVELLTILKQIKDERGRVRPRPTEADLKRTNELVAPTLIKERRLNVSDWLRGWRPVEIDLEKITGRQG